MTLSLRDIKSRIKAVENTRKITRAMEMVSASKLNKVEGALGTSHYYIDQLNALLKNTIAGREDIAHPLITERMPKKTIAFCVITSDTGLCSTYNDNVISIAENFLTKYDKSSVKLITVGKQGFAHFKKREFTITKAYIGLFGKYSRALADEITNILTGMFLSGEADEVYVAYTFFVSKARRIASIEKFLNIEHKFQNASADFILEPDRQSILDELLVKYNINRMRSFVLDSFASEHSSRMIAMKMATDNARDLIGNLILLRNKARQATITNEVLEIISTAEALKGG